MKSRTTASFREMFADLPPQVQRQARAAYKRFQQNTQHPGLHFKQVHATEPIYSARVGLHYRAVGIADGDSIAWFWIGSHADYDYAVGANVALYNGWSAAKEKQARLRRRRGKSAERADSARNLGKDA